MCRQDPTQYFDAPRPLKIPIGHGHYLNLQSIGNTSGNKYSVMPRFSNLWNGFPRGSRCASGLNQYARNSPDRTSGRIGTRCCQRQSCCRAGYILENGVPTGIRTPVYAVRGRRPGPLDDGDLGARPLKASPCRVCAAPAWPGAARGGPLILEPGRGCKGFPADAPVFAQALPASALFRHAFFPADACNGKTAEYSPPLQRGAP